MLLFTLTLLACSGHRRVEQQLLSKADSAMSVGDYRKAVDCYKAIDTIDLTDTDLRQRAIRLRRQAKWMLNMQTLDSLDAAWREANATISRIGSSFLLFENKEYGIRPSFARLALSAKANTAKSHLRLVTDSTGVVTLTSVYVGRKPIRHTALLLRDRESGQTFFSAQIPYDEALNYRYATSDLYYELVNYPSSIADSLATFVRSIVRLRHTMEAVLLDASSRELPVAWSYSTKQLTDFVDTFALAEAYACEQRMDSSIAMLRSENRYLLSTGHVDTTQLVIPRKKRR